MRQHYADDRYSMYLRNWYSNDMARYKSLTIGNNANGNIVAGFYNVCDKGGTLIDDYFYFSTIVTGCDALYSVYRFHIKNGVVQKLIDITDESNGSGFEEKHLFQVEDNLLTITYTNEVKTIDLTPFN